MERGYEVGLTYKAVLMVERGYSAGVSPYPNWYMQEIPVKIVEEYPSFYVVEVLEHINKHCVFPAVPYKPYKVTIDKFMIKTGEMILR